MSSKFKQEIFNDHYQNYKRYNIHKAQLIIADIPYNIGKNAYGSNPKWYIDGDNTKGESELAGSQFFRTDNNFKPAEFMHFCSKMLKKEPKARGQAPAMIVFCSFEQQFYLIELAKKYGFSNYTNLVFRKNYSAQVLKANMRVVGNAEYGIIFYREKLPKFNNNGKMIFNVMEWERDNDSPKIHPNQKPVQLLIKLIEIFTDIGDTIIDPVAGSGTSLVAAIRRNRKAYGFEIDKDCFKKARSFIETEQEIRDFGYPKTEMKDRGEFVFS